METRVKPWVTTDSRIPYLVFEGLLSGALDRQTIIEEFGRVWTRVSNVYGTAAFAIDNEYERLFCIADGASCALIDLAPAAGAAPGAAGSKVPTIYVRRCLKWIRQVNDTLAGMEVPAEFSVTSLYLELSGVAYQ